MARRLIIVFLVFLIGLAGGLYYGWVINPVRYTETSIDSLHRDYRTDYVLMVAEAYHAERDLDLAARRLGLLGSLEPILIAREAYIAGRDAGYAERDLELIDALALDFRTWAKD